MTYWDFRKSGSTGTETIPSPGRPAETTTPEMINKIHYIILNNSEVKVREKALCKMGDAITHNHVNV